MKKVMFLMAWVFVLAFIFISGCAKESSPQAPVSTATPVVPTATFTATASPTETFTPSLNAYVTLRKLVYVNNQRTPVPDHFYSIEVSDHGTPVVNATVVVNATPVTYEGITGVYGRYRIFNMNLVTGMSYTTNIYYKNLTLTSTLVIPGGQVLNANADSVSWTDGGSSRSINIFNSSSVNTYGAVMSTSPFSIPTGTAYPAPGTYSIACVIARNGTFSGTAQPYLNSGYPSCDEYFQYTIVK